MIQKKIFKIENALYEKQMTLYVDDEVKSKACVLYFHGGGFLYGSREDLPDYHLNALTSAGYAILAYDYPLAPAAKLPVIHKDICESVNNYLLHAEEYVGASLPYFLWGRSAGAYLCLLAAANGTLAKQPSGILSYYGYGLLCDNWFNTPSPYYQTLPEIPASSMEAITDTIEATGSLETHYMRYVYARQSGTWKDLFFADRDKYLYLNYSLRLCDKLPCPLFCAHGTGDPDVPYEEFMELNKKYKPQIYIASSEVHDFDRVTTTSITQKLLESTIEFLNENIN